MTNTESHISQPSHLDTPPLGSELPGIIRSDSDTDLEYMCSSDVPPEYYERVRIVNARLVSNVTTIKTTLNNIELFFDIEIEFAPDEIVQIRMHNYKAALWAFSVAIGTIYDGVPFRAILQDNNTQPAQGNLTEVQSKLIGVMGYLDPTRHYFIDYEKRLEERERDIPRCPKVYGRYLPAI